MSRRNVQPIRWMLSVVMVAGVACGPTNESPRQFGFVEAKGARFLSMPVREGKHVLVRVQDVWVCEKGTCVEQVIDAGGCAHCAPGNCDCRLPACAPVCQPDGLERVTLGRDPIPDRPPVPGPEPVPQPN